MSIKLYIILFSISLFVSRSSAQSIYYENSFSFSTSINFDVEEPFNINPLESRTANSLLVGFESKKIFNLLYYNVGSGYQQNRFKQEFEAGGKSLGFYNFSTLELKIQIGIGIEKIMKQTNSSVYFECGFSPDYLIGKTFQVENTNELLIPQLNNILYSNFIKLNNSNKIISALTPYFNIGSKVKISEKILLRTYCQLVIRDDYITTTRYSFIPTAPNGIGFTRNPLNNTLIKISRFNLGFRLIYSL